MSGRLRPTARDVAELAGVSTATVSRALSGRRAVGPEVQAKVQAAARQIGYVPNHHGSALRRQESATLGILVPRITNPFYPQVLEHLQAAAAEAGYQVLITVSNYEPTTEADRLSGLLSRNVDGCLVVPASASHSGETLNAAHAVAPIIQVDGWATGADVPHVGMDNEDAVTQLVEHLLAQGRRSLVFVSGGLATSPDIERRDAFLAIASRRETSAQFVEIPGEDYSFEAGQSAMRRLLQSQHLPDAVIGSNDIIALGAMEELLDAGVRVPDDVSVCGIDDIGYAHLSRPPLTTVRQPLAEMASAALERVSSDFSSKKSPAGSVRFPGLLMVRKSCSLSP